jgi:tRNA dimethylallyltransferase
MKKTIVIAGPTASGKSNAAMRLAADTAGVIINADSLQLYKDLPILTAQPSAADQQKIPHKLYALLDPHDEFSVAKWLQLATNEIRQAQNPIVVGGTGLYLKALQEGLSYIPKVAPEIRQQVRGLTVDEAYELLLAKDPAAAAKLHANDSQRVSRALEVVLSTGKSITEWQQNNDKSLIADIKVQLAVLLPDLQELHHNAEKRLHAMFAGGAIDEVAHLHGDLAPTIRKAIGFREITAYINGEISKEEALNLAIIATKQYIKRQRTWFRNQFPDAVVFTDGESLVRGI